MRTLMVAAAQVYAGELILVNSRHAYRAADIPPRMVAARADFPEILLQRTAAASLAQLMARLDCAAQIVPVSGLRGVQEQQEIYEDCLRAEGVGYTTDFVALPHCSEHHTGLAIDVAENQPQIDFICPEFGYTGVCADFRALAASYGFILRYQKAKQAVTGVAEEPWHFRYVGCPHAQIIEERGWALEEYIAYLKQFREQGERLNYRAGGVDYQIFCVPVAGNAPVALTLAENLHCSISGNNEAELIVTLW